MTVRSILNYIIRFKMLKFLVLFAILFGKTMKNFSAEKTLYSE